MEKLKGGLKDMWSVFSGCWMELKWFYIGAITIFFIFLGVFAAYCVPPSIVLSGMMTENSIMPIIGRIKTLEAQFKHKDFDGIVYLYVDSNGGDAGWSLNLAEIVANSPLHIVTIGMSKAMSGALLVVAAGDERWAYPHCLFLIHDIRYSKFAPEKFTLGDAERTVKNMRLQQTAIEKFIAKHSKLTLESIPLYTKYNEETFFNAAEAKKLGIIDHIGVK